MSGFNFEKHLPHQEKGVSAVLDVFNDVEVDESADATSRLLANTHILSYNLKTKVAIA